MTYEQEIGDQQLLGKDSRKDQRSTELNIQHCLRHQDCLNLRIPHATQIP